MRLAISFRVKILIIKGTTSMLSLALHQFLSFSLAERILVVEQSRFKSYSLNGRTLER